MAKERILIVEDEDDILELVRYNLTKEGYQVDGVTSGEDAIRKVKTTHYDLLLLDLMLPGVGGLEVCTTLKRDPRTADLPVIMLTARGEETDVVVGLELGADDYVTKPFGLRVLLARIKAVLRRKHQPEPEQAALLTIGELYIDASRYEVRVQGKPVQLTTTEFGILIFLARRPGWVFTRYQIVDAVKGEDYVVTDRAVDVQIAGLRKKLGPLSDCIETVRGVGYRFRNDDYA